jgi:hypothetical protein
VKYEMAVRERYFRIGRWRGIVEKFGMDIRSFESEQLGSNS